MNANSFNAAYPVGTPVFAYPGARPEDIPSARRLVTRTRSRASVLGGHTDVVWVDGHSACIALSHVDVVPEAEWEAAKTAEAVAAQGALPMPVGDQPQPLTELKQVSAEIARFGIYGAAVPATKALVKRADQLVTENAELQARVAELEEQDATARTAALNEAADWFEQRADSEPDQNYRARVMRGAANDVRRLATEAAAS